MTKEEERLVKSVVDSWQISNNFTQGDKIKLVVAKGKDWDRYVEPPVEDVPFFHKFVYVNITDPNEENTMFEVTYVKQRENLFLYNITVIATTDGFIVQNESKGIVGYAGVDGVYKATAIGALPPGGGPPGSMTFFKIKKRIIVYYPYSYLLHPGIAMFLFGITLFVLGTTYKRVRRGGGARIKSKHIQKKGHSKL
jgi:hypothetical protein